MSENSHDLQGSPGLFSNSPGIVIAVAAVCVVLGACVLCGGGLAFPLVLRNQRQRAAADAERAAADAQREAMEKMRDAQEALQREQEALRKPAEQEEVQQPDASSESGDGHDKATERVDPR